jgi:tetratricopeptide (TPR) repeat protein
MAIALSARCKARAMLGLDLSAALKDCNAAISRSGKLQNPDFLDNLALVRFRLGDYEKSLGGYDAALKIRPKNAWTLYGRGLAKLKKNDRSGGEGDIAEAVSIAPGVAEAYKKMGLAP